jgi:hypothetical protein
VCSSRGRSAEAGGIRSIRPISFKYSGVTESAIASPMASWNPSLAPLRKRNGWFR